MIDQNSLTIYIQRISPIFTPQKFWISFHLGFSEKTTPLFVAPWFPPAATTRGLVQGALASAATETLAASCNFLIGRNFLKDPHATGTLPVVCLVRYGYPPLKVLDLFFRWWLFWRIFWHDRDSPWKNTELEECLLFFPTTERANLRSWTWFTWKIRVGRLLLPFGKGSCSGAVQTTC